ncbi:hypothetical protein M3593_04030 [Mesobacillus sp. MER 48]|nr:hypothetical protein [Mesobacillus sp. MER 33]MCM3232281.1 hypothetical protein [Mesobacillus sp. MER 48]
MLFTMLASTLLMGLATFL